MSECGILVDNFCLWIYFMFHEKLFLKTGEFKIYGIFFDKENVSCKFCKYKDLCYMKQNDIVKLSKVEDLSFLREYKWYVDKRTRTSNI